jgi:hypothetical protein
MVDKLPRWYVVRCDECQRHGIVLYSCVICCLDFCYRDRKSHEARHDWTGVPQ